MRRSFAGEHAAGDGDVFAAGFLRRRDRVRQRAAVTDLGELHQHRQVDAGEHLDLGPAHARDREVRRGSTEHVGEDGHAVARVDALDRFYDVASAEIGVIVSADRDRFDLFLWTHYVLERRLELVGETPMGHEYHTDHRRLLVQASFALHERATMLTIRLTLARGKFAS